MPSDYKSIRKDNIKEYGEGRRHLSFLEKLYTDRTHFIFEFLQNAEDAGAKRILFELFSDRLEVKHNGRPFNESDVRGVCGIGEGEKTGDLTKIGEFGIGFKSVYAYTSAPEIHSGDEHLRIEHYVRPHEEERMELADWYTTLFLLPFKMEVQGAAYDEIAERLRNLSVRTLLFLRKIKEIEYKLENGESGEYLYEQRKRGYCREVTVIGHNNGQDEDESWLIFERSVKASESGNNSAGSVPVEIGFLLENEGPNEKIVRIKNSRLIVSFSTDKETHLGFLVQGPYRTTPARDNIPKDNDWNKKLIEETAALLTEQALPRLKEMGFLTVSLLEAMPIRMDDFPEDDMFFPIAEAVCDALRNHELLPADNKTFVAAQNAKLARGAKLRIILNQNQLSSLFRSDNKIKWLNGEITQDRTPDLRTYLIKNLDVEEITGENFTPRLSKQFLEEQSDDWIVLFYEYAYDRKDLWNSLKSKPVVRLQDGSHVRPVRDDGSPGAYITEESNTKTSFPVVKAELILSEDAGLLLKKLGVEDLDLIAEVIEEILPKYTNSPSEISADEHLDDINRIERAWAKATQEKKKPLREKLMSIPFILQANEKKDARIYKKPSDLYFENDDLRLYFSGNPHFGGFASTKYRESTMKFLEDLGVSTSVGVLQREGNWKNFVIIRSCYGDHERGINGFDPGIKVEGLKNALDSPTLEKSEFIWNSIALPYSDCVRGTVESSTKQTYEDSTKEEKVSERFGRLLIGSAWLPKNGSFRKPSELTLEDLPSTFERDEKLAQKLGMKLNVVAKLAKEGVLPEECLEFIELINKHPDSVREKFQQFKKDISDQNRKTVFPEKPTSDPERMQEKIAEQIEEASEKKYEQQKRKIRITRNTVDPSTLLRDWYINDAGEMVCQICKEEMPFKKRDGEYYFEAVEALPKEHFPKELEELFLALCPLCAAKYKEFVKRDEEAIYKLKDDLMNRSNCEIPLGLGDHQDKSIRFVEDHYLRIKEIVQKL
ncbi:MAG: hypothetical protein OXC79_00025 [Candidatus Poribacteria bacterium]|nr:hypothetical protein [Candidatus Poribacteria bacterium]